VPRTMLDGIDTDAAGIARLSPQMVAYYVNGRYAWSAAQIAMFPHANHVTISVTASADAGDVLDVETGDATPAQAEGWIAKRKAAGLYRPTIYCSRSTIPAVRAGTGSYVLGKDYDIWVADYTGTPHVVASSVVGGVTAICAATQYENTANWDVSAVYDDGWPHRTPPAPVKTTTPVEPVKPVEETDMIVLSTKLDGKTVTTYTYNGETVRHIVSDADNTAMVAKLGPAVPVTPKQLQTFNGGQLPPM